MLSDPGHIVEVIDFYARVGELWANKDYPLRQEATKLAAKVTGYDEIMIDHDMALIPDLTRTMGYLGDVLDTELGNRQYLDEWIPFQNVYRHAQPRMQIFPGGRCWSSSFGLGTRWNLSTKPHNTLSIC